MGEILEHTKHQPDQHPSAKLIAALLLSAYQEFLAARKQSELTARAEVPIMPKGVAQDVSSRGSSFKEILAGKEER